MRTKRVTNTMNKDKDKRIIYRPFREGVDKTKAIERIVRETILECSRDALKESPSYRRELEIELEEQLQRQVNISVLGWNGDRIVVEVSKEKLVFEF